MTTFAKDPTPRANRAGRFTAAPGPGPAPGKLGKGGPKGKAAPTRAKFVCPGCKAAAAEEGVKVATYCREAILARAMPEPEFPDVATLPAWLLHFILFVTRGRTKPV